MNKKFTTVKDLRNEETLQMLAELWANRTFREYIFNLRNIEIQNLKKIKTGTIEGDALELQRGNGRIEALEKLMSVAQHCYADFEKIKLKRKGKTMGEDILEETPVVETPVETSEEVITPEAVETPATEGTSEAEEPSVT